MKKAMLKKMLREESKNFVPDMKSQVLSQIPSSVAQKKPLWKTNFKQAWAFSLSVILIVIVGITYFGFKGLNTQAFENSLVSVDINPSVELEADAYDLVVGYRSMNLDAQLLLEEDGLVLTGKTIDAAIELIVDLAIEYGYLDTEDVEAEVLVTAINRNSDFEQQLNSRLETKMTLLSQKKNLKGEVILEQANEAVKQQAKDYKMSVGKMILVNRARNANPNLTMTEAAKLSVKQLNEIATQYDSQKIQDFQTAYENKLEGLTEMKNGILTQLEDKEATIVETIDGILEMIEEAKPLQDINNEVNDLLTEHFPNVHPENLTTYNRYEIFLKSLREFTISQSERIANLVKTKYTSQVKAFRFQMQGNMNDEQIDFEFVFDDDFDPKYFPDDDLPVNNQTEERILEIINQVSTYISIINMNPGKHHGQSERAISLLMNQFAALMESPQVSTDFKTSSPVTDFITLYNQFLEN
ncbi:MAG: hypothetical protein AB7T03_01850 [Bacilli bacterium]